MKKTRVILSALVMLLTSQFASAEVYTYTGPNFTSVSGPYTTSMSVTGTITTSSPIPPDQTNYSIGGLVDSWTMSDGYNTLQGPDPGTILIANVDTNSAGEIVGGFVGAFTLPFRTQVGDIQDWIVTDSAGPLNQGIDDLECIEDDGEGTCTNNTSAGSGNVQAYGTWTGGSVPEATYSVGGSVSGLTGTGLELQNNGTDTLAVTADGPFTFVTALADGSDYAVTVSTEPSGQTCDVTNGSGTIAGSNVTSVSVACQDVSAPPVAPPATALPIPALADWALLALSVLLGLAAFLNRKRLS
jgi:hypothetical protein